MSKAAHSLTQDSVAMESSGVEKTARLTRDAVWSYASICLGVAAAIGWFIYSLQVPPAYRGVICCDAAEYVGIGSQGILKALTHVSHRTYGYPFFASLVFAFFGDKNTELMALLITQLMLHTSSVVFLGWALQRAGYRIHALVIFAVLTTPFLANIAAVSLTDSLATSLFTALLAIQVLMAHGTIRMAALSFVSGLALGYLAAVRPVFVFIIPVFLGVTLVSCARRGFSWANFKTTILATILWGCGVSLCLGGVVWNCHSLFGSYCLVNPSESGHNLSGSFNYAIENSRFDGVIASSGYFAGWAPTPDRVFPVQCGSLRDRPFGSLFDCYKMNQNALVRYFSRRLIGLFDIRAINPYAVSVTPIRIAWINRAYGLLAFVGLPLIALLTVTQIFRRSPWEYLLLPLAYVVVQVNFHVENRYIFPVIPICLYVAVAALSGCTYRRAWSLGVIWIGAIMLGAAFISVVMAWDAVHFAQYKYL